MNEYNNSYQVCVCVNVHVLSKLKYSGGVKISTDTKIP